MPRIIIGPTKCQIIDEDDTERRRKLDRELSFFIAGAEHSKSYLGYIDSNGKQITWDGRKHLLTESTMKFLPGLLNRVRNFYDVRKIPYDLIDTRPKHDPSYPCDITKKLGGLGIMPYPYQLKAVETAQKYSHGIIRMATGSGKTAVAALLVAALGKNTCLYVIGKDLLYQMHNLFNAVFDQPIGIIGDGKCEVHNINIATIWTVGAALGLRDNLKAEEEEKEKIVPSEKHKEIRDMLGRARVHILDECHLASCSTVQGIAGRIKPENVYGMSASPWRDDNSDLLIEAFLGNKIVNISAKKLIKEGYLVEPFIKFLSVPKYKGKLGKHYQTIYKNYIVENDVRNEMVVKGAVKLVEQGYQTLILFHSIKHGKILYEKMSSQLRCELLSGKDSQKRRDEVKAKLENGEINCIIASKIFDIGVDLPSLSGLVMAGGGKSSVRALQRVGRVIRKHPGKTNAAIIDFADQAKYLLSHSERRRDICGEEFKVQWPEKKIN